MSKGIVLAIDALEYELVEKFDYKNLKQKHYGKTDISEFRQPRTIVLWASFLSGKNIEGEILKLGDEKMWDFKIEKEDSFLEKFHCKVIDLPAFSYDKEQHEKERRLLKEFFEKEDEEKAEEIKKRYNKNAFEHHKKIKEEFFSVLEEDYDLVIGYFSIVDVIGHLNFGNEALMKIIYKDMDDIAKKAKEYGKVLILSDHGMKRIGRFGDHNRYGFWSFDKGLKKVKITEFAEIIKTNFKNGKNKISL